MRGARPLARRARGNAFHGGFSGGGRPDAGWGAPSPCRVADAFVTIFDTIRPTLSSGCRPSTTPHEAFDLSLGVSALNVFDNQKTLAGEGLASPAGFEPATYSLGGCRSILLSYGPATTGIILAQISSVGQGDKGGRRHNICHGAEKGENFLFSGVTVKHFCRSRKKDPKVSP